MAQYKQAHRTSHTSATCQKHTQEDTCWKKLHRYHLLDDRCQKTKSAVHPTEPYRAMTTIKETHNIFGPT